MSKSNLQPLIEFNPKLPKLSKNEKEVLRLLVDAGRLIAPIYLEQEKQAQIVISQDDIKEAAKKDPSFLSPYTLVEEIDGKLVATPYHIKYALLLEPVAEKLEKAADISENKEFGKVLRKQAKALLDGSYEEATAAWTKMEPYVLDASFGPLDYFNRLFAGKAVYQAWVGVLDFKGTGRLNDYKNIIHNANRKALIPRGRIDNAKTVKAVTIDEVLLAGLMARSPFVGLNIPMDFNLVKKNGAGVVIFNQANELRMKEQIRPTFNKIFSQEFKETFTADDLRRASLRYVALHELAHNYLYYKNSVKNLQDLFPVIYELTATLLGLRIAGSLLLIDRIDNKQLESMIVAFICRSYDLFEKTKNNKLLINYALGGIIFINYMIESGALKQKEGMAIPNFMKIFASIHELSYNLERLLALGTRKDAEVFIKKYI